MEKNTFKSKLNERGNHFPFSFFYPDLASSTLWIVLLHLPLLACALLHISLLACTLLISLRLWSSSFASQPTCSSSLSGSRVRLPPPSLRLQSSLFSLSLFLCLQSSTGFRQGTSSPALGKASTPLLTKT